MAGGRGPRAALSPAEKQRRLQQGLCLYCGEDGHIRTTCPHRQRVVQAQQQPRPVQPRLGRTHGVRPTPPRPQRQQRTENPNYEPIGARRRTNGYPANDAPEYDDANDANDDVEMDDALAAHHAETIQESTSPAKKVSHKEVTKGQFITGLGWPGGPAHLVHGTEKALTELEMATGRDKLTIIQQPPQWQTSELAEALMASVEHLKIKGEFPRDFLPISLGRPMQDGEEAQDFQAQQVGQPAFKAVDTGRAATMLNLASISKQTETGRPIVYQLGILTYQSSGGSRSYRARLVTSPGPKLVEGEPDVKVIWLYRRIEGDALGSYSETWRGFGKRDQDVDEAGTGPPIHPTTGNVLQRVGEGYVESSPPYSVKNAGVRVVPGSNSF